MNAVGIWVLVIILNGQSADFPDGHKTNASCEEHRQRLDKALKQAQSKGIVRCEWRSKYESFTD